MDKSSSIIRQYYVAVGHVDQKVHTLLELLTAIQLQAEHKLATVVVCSSRDTLDTIVCALQDTPLFNVFALHSDLTDAERQFQVSRFQSQAEQPTGAGPEAGLQRSAGSSRDGTGRGAQAPAVHGGPQPPDSVSLVLVTTDVCLRAIPRELQPMGSPVSLLIQYDLPNKKEQMTRRITTVLGSARDAKSRRIVIDFVVAGEVPAFRAVEKFTAPIPILQMPVHVGEMFA